MEKESTLSEHTNQHEEDDCSIPQNIDKNAEGAARGERDKLMSDLRKDHRTEDVDDDDRVSYVESDQSSQIMETQSVENQMVKCLMEEIRDMRRQAREETEKRDRKEREETEKRERQAERQERMQIEQIKELQRQAREDREEMRRQAREDRIELEARIHELHRTEFQPFCRRYQTTHRFRSVEKTLTHFWGWKIFIFYIFDYLNI